MAWVEKEAITLRESAKRDVTVEFKQALDYLCHIFDADLTRCNLYENADSIFFKNPVVRTVDKDGKIGNTETKILVEFFQYTPGRWDITSYRNPRGLSTFVNGAPIRRAVTELQRICLHADPWFEQ